MAKPTVMVTGVGAVIGLGIIQAIKAAELDVRIIGADAEPQAVGFGFVDRGVTVPRADAPHYTEFLVDYARKHGVALLIPGIEQDLDRMVAERSAFEGSGFVTLLPDHLVYDITTDKWRSHLFLCSKGFPVIPTFKLEEDEALILDNLSFPLILKPRSAFGGKGLLEVSDLGAFRYHRERIGSASYIVQQKMGNSADEFTCGSYLTKDGTLLGPIVLRRKLGYGSTVKATCESLPALESRVNEVLVALEAGAGPYCTQIRLSGDEPLILEINARFSSSTSIKAMLGFNEPAMLIREIMYGQTPEQPCIAYGKTVCRYLADYAIE